MKNLNILSQDHVLTKVNYKMLLSLIFIFGLFCLSTTQFKIFWTIICLLAGIYLLFYWQYFLISVMVFLILIIIFNLNIKSSKLPNNVFIEDNFVIVDKNQNGVYIRFNDHKIFVKTKILLQINDTVFVRGFILKTYQKLNNGITLILKCQDFKIIKLSTSFFSQIHRFLANNSWTYFIVLGQKNDVVIDMYKQSIILRLAHMFVVSGFHFNVLFRFFNKIFQLLNKNKLVNEVITCILLWIYTYFLNFSISSLRAILMLSFGIINQHYFDKRYDRFLILVLTLIICAFLNPEKIFAINFILTFLATFCIILSQKIAIKNLRIKKFLMLSILYFVTLPLDILINKNINICGPFYSLILSPLVFALQFLSLILFFYPLLLNLICSNLMIFFNWFVMISLIISFNNFEIINCLIIYALIFNSIIILGQCNLFLGLKLTGFAN